MKKKRKTKKQRIISQRTSSVLKLRLYHILLPFQNFLVLATETTVFIQIKPPLCMRCKSRLIRITSSVTREPTGNRMKIVSSDYPDQLNGITF